MTIARTKRFVVSTLIAAALSGGSLAQGPRLQARLGSIDLTKPLDVPLALRAGEGCSLHVVQFKRALRSSDRVALAALGVEVGPYLPDQAYLCRVASPRLSNVRKLVGVHAVAPWHPALRLDAGLWTFVLGARGDVARRCNVMVFDKRRDAVGVAARVGKLGGRVEIAAGGGVLLEATLTATQLAALLQDDRVLWVDGWSRPEIDIDNARIQGGSNYVEAVAGIDGQGVRGHVLEGVFATHVELSAIPGVRLAPIGVGDSRGQEHGTNTAGEIYARGARASARGLLPNAQLLYTNYFYVLNNASRYALTRDLVDRSKPYRVMMQTSSWGYARTTQYTSRSAEMDDIILDHDLFITQAHGNSGSSSRPNDSRPQAWAKNIVSVGGFFHNDNADPRDDRWNGGGSTGPAADGRIGLTLSGYYDSVLTISGSTNGYTPNFGGTSAAAPLIQGFGGAAIEMFTDGLFGYPKAPTPPQRYLYTPRAATTKALLLATARQLVWANANRYQQGMGFPNLRTMFDARDRMLVIDGLDVLRTGAERVYYMFVPPGTTELHAAMAYPDPPAVPSAARHRVNSVDLEVTLSDGRRYFGNGGLLAGPTSVPGTPPDDLNTEENVYLRNPVAGLARIVVRATRVRTDAHLATPALDVDYGLVVRGLGGLRDRSGLQLTLASASPGDLRVGVSGLPAGWVRGYTLFSANTSRPRSTGNVVGLESDGLTQQGIAQSAARGNVFHFLPGTASSYPNAPFAFPRSVARAVQGATLDAVIVLFDAAGNLVAVSNVARVSVR